MAPPLRVEADEFDEVRHAAACSADDAAENLGEREDGRAHVECEAVFAEHVHFAAKVLVRFDDGDLCAPPLQLDRRGQACKASADDDDTLWVAA